MAQNAERRLIKDLKKIQSETADDSIMAMPDEKDMFKWEAIICGPEDTEWEGGIFKLQMTFTDAYPNKPPEVKFVTDIFHPNVYKDGKICLDILKEQWSPVYDVQSILISIQQLMTDPNNKSPANNEASLMHQNNYKEYQRRVREMVKKSQEEASDDDDDDDDEDEDEEMADTNASTDKATKQVEEEKQSEDVQA